MFKTLSLELKAFFRNCIEHQATYMFSLALKTLQDVTRAQKAFLRSSSACEVFRGFHSDLTSFQMLTSMEDLSQVLSGPKAFPGSSHWCLKTSPCSHWFFNSHLILKHYPRSTGPKNFPKPYRFPKAFNRSSTSFEFFLYVPSPTTFFRFPFGAEGETSSGPHWDHRSFPYSQDLGYFPGMRWSRRHSNLLNWNLRPFPCFHLGWGFFQESHEDFYLFHSPHWMTKHSYSIAVAWALFLGPSEDLKTSLRLSEKTLDLR